MSRKFLVPIQLPADPTQPLEAATKQYVDGKSGDEVFVGTADPGVGAGYELWYDTDDPGVSPSNFAQVEDGSYTPTLTNFVLGAGGANNAYYRFVGGVGVGAKGILFVWGNLTFGTSGQTFPQAGSETISLPAGFNIVNMTNTSILGMTTMQVGGSNFAGGLWSSGSAALRLLVQSISGSVTNWADLTATVPGTWAAGSGIIWAATMPAVRV